MMYWGRYRAICALLLIAAYAYADTFNPVTKNCGFTGKQIHQNAIGLAETVKVQLTCDCGAGGSAAIVLVDAKGDPAKDSLEILDGDTDSRSFTVPAGFKLNLRCTGTGTCTYQLAF
jgi:hypothetical protein